MDREKMDLSERSNSKGQREHRAPRERLQRTGARRREKEWPRSARRQNQTGAVRLDNTRKLVLAALRLWELKQGSVNNGSAGAVSAYRAEITGIQKVECPKIHKTDSVMPSICNTHVGRSRVGAASVWRIRRERNGARRRRIADFQFQT